MGKEITCFICKHKKTTCAKHDIASKMICLQCRATHCTVCHKPLSKEEVTRLPTLRATFYFCVECFEQEYKKREGPTIARRQAELKKMQTDFMLQTRYQKCACGLFNTSRDRAGRVTAKKCKTCESIKKDEAFLIRIASKKYF